MNIEQKATKTALILAFNSFDFKAKVTSHHLSEYLLTKDFKVLYLSDAVSPFHIFKIKRTKTNINRIIKAFKIYQQPQPNLIKITPFAFLPVENILPFNFDFCADFHVKSFWYPVEQIIDHFLKINRPIDLVWINNPKFCSIIDRVNYKKLVYSIEDDLFEFSRIPKSLKRNHNRLINEATLITVTSIPLVEEIKSTYGENVFHKTQLLRNGVNLNFLKERSELLFPIEYKYIPEPRVVYVGVISSWFDINLVAKAAKSLPNCSFVLIGPVEISTASLRQYKNIHLLGGKPHSTLPDYLQNAQVGIIPFLRTKLVESVNPIKLYEYMASGLPVVSKTWKELEVLNSPALLAKEDNDFINLIDKLTTKSLKIEKEALLHFAQSNSWEEKFNHLMEILKIT